MATGVSADDPGLPGLKLPLSEDATSAWHARLDAAVKAADAKKTDWKPYVTAYMVRSAAPAAGEHAVTVPLIYAYTELKKSQLRFQVPEVNLKPKRPEWAGAARAFEGALNHEIKEAGADAMLDMVTTDVLICGIAAAKVGYYADIRTKQVPVLELPKDVYGQDMPVNLATGQPNEPQPKIDPLTGEPVTTTEQYVAHECYYGDRIAPENLLLPPEFQGGDYDRAAYLGHRDQIDLQTAIARYGLPKDFAPTATRPIETLSSEEQGEGRDSLTTKDVEVIEVFYLASVFYEPPAAAEAADAPAVEPPHVGQYRRLVFVKGRQEPVVHEDCQYQYVDPVDGRLKGMRGNPIHILTLRYLPGSAYPVSDVEAGFPSSEEVNLGRSQMVNFRERVMPILAVDRTKATPEIKASLEANANVKLNKVLGVDGDPDGVIRAVALQQFPRENFKFNEVAEDSFRLAWSMGKNQAGLTEDGEPVTATEVNAAQVATDTRLAYEQGQFLKWFCKYAEKFGALLQLFKDEPGFALIVGDDGVKALQAWNRTGAEGVASIDGEFVYTARPDAALRLDINADRASKQRVYNLLGNDPNFNRAEWVKTMMVAEGVDPEKYIVTQLPEKKPEPPRISWSFKGEDLSPVDSKTGQPNPAFPLVLSIAQQGGIEFPPEAIQNAMTLAQTLMQLGAMMPQPALPGAPQMEHGGAATPMQPIVKQMADRTTNGAAAAPMPSGVQ